MTRVDLRWWAVLGVLTSLGAYAADPGRGTVQQAGAEVEEIAKQIELARNDIDLVERQYTLVAEESDEAARAKRFSEGMTRYLLEEYGNAAVHFYDLVANPAFQQSAQYGEALFYLADSLYRQKNYLGARLYFRQLLALKGDHYKEALERYLEICGRLNEFSGVDDYIEQAKSISKGGLPPELNYVYAKSLFRRDDLKLEDRLARAQQIFGALAADRRGGFHEQSAYFIGVSWVKLKEWDKAIEVFKTVASDEARDEKERAVRELAELSLGRVYFEVGKYDEAIEHYERIPQQSENFPDSLYEIAWSYVRKGELEKAKNATEVLLLVAENSVLDPEARILQGTLLQKLQRYDDAIGTYNQVINTYAPVRDEIEALLNVNQDPVKYFDELLARNERSLDVTKLLPPVALKWASTRQDVADAMQITTALDQSRQGILESRTIADRILKSLDERGLESFPLLQEGYTRADAVDTSITRAEERLTRIERDLSGNALSAEQQGQLADLQGKAEALKKRIATLPTTSEQIQARKARIQQQIDALDKQAFQLSIELQSQQAQLTAIKKYVDDTRSQRKSSAADEKAFLEKVSLEQRGIEGTQGEIDELRAKLLEERTNADAAIGGEATLRAEYAKLLQQQQAIFASVRGAVPGDVQKVLWRSDVVKADAASVRERVGRSKGIIRDRVGKRAQLLREQVLAEQGLIENYTKETEGVTGETRNLVGRIAFDSFKRVRQSFYDLVLKADVGLVDVTFQRKQDKTSQIQKLAAQKERELKQLDDEFKEVLKDVD